MPAQKRRQQRSLGRIVCQAASNGKVPGKPRRVVVTGMGVVSTLGHDPDEFYSNLLQVRHVSGRQPCASKLRSAHHSQRGGQGLRSCTCSCLADLVREWPGAAVKAYTRALHMTRAGCTGVLLEPRSGAPVQLTTQRVLQGNSGVSLIQGFNTEDFSTRFAGEIHGFGCNGYVPKKMERRMDATIKYIMVSGKKARPRAPCKGCVLAT